MKGFSDPMVCLCDHSNVEQPIGSLVQGLDGSFYGTTWRGGLSNDGTVFSISPAGTFKILHEFSGIDGTDPVCNLLLAVDGNFYGTTEYGGSNGTGAIFQITPTGALTVIHSFKALTGTSTEQPTTAAPAIMVRFFN